MNFLAGFAFFQCLLFLIVPQSHGIEFRVYVCNFVEDKRVIGISWPGEDQVLIEYVGKHEFQFELKKAEELIFEPKMQFDFETKDGVEEEFMAFTYADFPSKMLLLKDDDTLYIYYVVKKTGMYLWDYYSHLRNTIQSGRHTTNPRDEHLIINKQWQTMRD